MRIYGNNPRGISALELLVVVAIIAVATAIGLIMIGDTDGVQLRAVAEQTMALLTLAQNHAIARQTPVQFVYNADDNCLELRDADGAVLLGNPSNLDGRQRVYFGAGTPYPRVTLESFDFDGEAVLWFDALGAPHSGAVDDEPWPLLAGAVALNARDLQTTITVQPFTGQLALE